MTMMAFLRRLHVVAAVTEALMLATFLMAFSDNHHHHHITVAAFQIPSLAAASPRRRRQQRSTSNNILGSYWRNHPSTTQLDSSSPFTSSSSSSELLSVERSTPRQIGPYQEWAFHTAGVQADEGFCLYAQQTDYESDLEEYYAATSTGGTAGSCVLYVPAPPILSATRLGDDYAQQGIDLSSSWSLLDSMGMSQLYPQFVLFVKLLMEYEQGPTSAYYPWLDGLPRKWNTAVSMDDFCLSCLPPFLKGLCMKEINQLAAFMFALQSASSSLPLQPATKDNNALLKFAYNVVMTRSFPSTTTTTGDTDLQLMPMIDMFNHGYPGNAYLAYDDAGGCQVVLSQDVAPGEPLLLKYPADGGDALAINPSQLLATYGFLDETSLPATYCKFLFANPSPQLNDVGYADPSQLYFTTAEGGIAPAVWDVLLYSRLERKPALAETAQAFYQACVQGDEATKGAIHQQYFSETVKALQRHVNHILIEVHELTVKMNAYDASNHPRLPLLRNHHAMVTRTFEKVRQNLEQMLTS